MISSDSEVFNSIYCEKQLNALWNDFSAVHVDYSHVSASICNEGAISCIFPVVILVFGVSCYSCYIIVLRKKTMITLLVVELLAWIMLGMAWNFPGTLVRFINTLFFLAAGVSLHSYIIPQILDMIYQKSVEHFSAVQSSFWLKFLKQLANTLYFNLFQRVDMFHYLRIPSMKNLLNIVVSMVMADTCIYLIREWIPLSGHIRTENQTIAIAIVGGIWVLFCVEFAYSIISTQLDCCGVTLPLEMSHKHPLVAASIGEFWGVRWNPIFGKLLQDAFYKPLRYLGASRSICMVTCFAGSALLHAWPQYVATRSSLDALGLMAFFLLQGICLVLEVLIQRQLFPQKSISTPNVLPSVATGELSPVRISDLSATNSTCTSSATSLATRHRRRSSAKTNTNSNPKHSNKTSVTQDKVTARQKAALEYAHCCKSAPFQLSTELLLVTCILSAAYWGLEFRPGMSLTSIEYTQLGNTVAAVAVTSGLGATICYYNVRRYIHLHSTSPPRHCTVSSTSTLSHQDNTVYLYSLFLWSLIGWIWTVLSIILLLPLFSLPILRAFEDFNSASVFVGPLIRSFQLYFTA